MYLLKKKKKLTQRYLSIKVPVTNPFCDGHNTDCSARLVTVSASHLKIAQGVEAWWDLSQTVVVKVDLTDIWDADKAPIFYRLDLVKTQS